MITNIATAAIYVEDQQKSLYFWTKMLGFEMRANHAMGAEGNWIEVAPKGAQSCIVLYPKSMMANWGERRPSIVFFCDNVEKTYKELKSKGVKFTEEPKKMSWGVCAMFEDPDGNQFLLKQND